MNTNIKYYLQMIRVDNTCKNNNFYQQNINIVFYINLILPLLSESDVIELNIKTSYLTIFELEIENVNYITFNVKKVNYMLPKIRENINNSIQYLLHTKDIIFLIEIQSNKSKYCLFHLEYNSIINI